MLNPGSKINLTNTYIITSSATGYGMSALIGFTNIHVLFAVTALRCWGEPVWLDLEERNIVSAEVEGTGKGTFLYEDHREKANALSRSVIWWGQFVAMGEEKQANIVKCMATKLIDLQNDAYYDGHPTETYIFNPGEPMNPEHLTKWIEKHIISGGIING